VDRRGGARHGSRDVNFVVFDGNAFEMFRRVERRELDTGFGELGHCVAEDLEVAMNAGRGRGEPYDNAEEVASRAEDPITADLKVTARVGDEDTVAGSLDVVVNDPHPARRETFPLRDPDGRALNTRHDDSIAFDPQAVVLPAEGAVAPISPVTIVL
jgi:hypothetical protein